MLILTYLHHMHPFCLLCFQIPPQASLVQHIALACLAEGAPMKPAVVNQLVAQCKGDLRKSINSAQLWAAHPRDAGDHAEATPGDYL